MIIYYKRTYVRTYVVGTYETMKPVKYGGISTGSVSNPTQIYLLNMQYASKVIKRKNVNCVIIMLLYSSSNSSQTLLCTKVCSVTAKVSCFNLK